MKTEQWKFVPEFEGLYEVSNHGNVRSKTGVLKPYAAYKGYLYIDLYNGSKKSRKKFSVHRLVALVWVPNPDNKPEIDHINGINTDNRAENLRWVTRSENCSNENTRYKNGVTRRKKVNQYTLDGELVKTWLSASEIYRETGYAQGNVSQCCRGEKKQMYGFVWRYVD